jgi:putative redox protein
MESPSRPSAQVDDSGHGGVQMMLTTGPSRLAVDVPVAQGGLDLGPSPHDLVGAGLAACTAMTLRLYAKHKALPLADVQVVVRHQKTPDASPPDLYLRTITLNGPLDADQRQRLLEIAEKCPVHRMLTAGVRIETSLQQASAPI